MTEFDGFTTSVYYVFHLLIEGLPRTDGTHLSKLLDLNIPPDRGWKSNSFQGMDLPGCSSSKVFMEESNFCRGI
jgi:hypothetical protein